MLVNIEVNMATEIVQNYRFKLGDTIMDGTPNTGEIAVSRVGTALRLFMTEECLSFDCPSFELVETLAGLCSISRPMERSLLSMVLSEKNLSRLQKTFRKQGLHVSIAKSNEGLFKIRYLCALPTAMVFYITLTLPDEISWRVILITRGLNDKTK